MAGTTNKKLIIARDDGDELEFELIDRDQKFRLIDDLVGFKSMITVPNIKTYPAKRGGFYVGRKTTQKVLSFPVAIQGPDVGAKNTFHKELNNFFQLDKEFTIRYEEVDVESSTASARFVSMSDPSVRVVDSIENVILSLVLPDPIWKKDFKIITFTEGTHGLEYPVGEGLEYILNIGLEYPNGNDAELFTIRSADPVGAIIAFVGDSDTPKLTITSEDGNFIAFAEYVDIILAGEKVIIDAIRNTAIKQTIDGQEINVTSDINRSVNLSSIAEGTYGALYEQASGGEASKAEFYYQENKLSVL